MSEAAVTLDAGAAERRAMKISLRLDVIADNYETVMPMIREAISLRDDLALGYASPGAYVSDRFGTALSRLGVEVRREVVKELTAAGLSTRAIAPVVGVHHDTVARDVRRVVGTTPAPERVDTTTGEILDKPEPAQSAPAPTPVVGLDGKTYTRPAPSIAAAPRAPKRRALTDAFFDAAYDMGKAVERVHRLTTDDRFAQNAEKVAAKHRSDLLRARDLLEQVIDSLPKEEDTND